MKSIFKTALTLVFLFAFVGQTFSFIKIEKPSAELTTLEILVSENNAVLLDTVINETFIESMLFIHSDFLMNEEPSISSAKILKANESGSLEIAKQLSYHKFISHFLKTHTYLLKKSNKNIKSFILNINPENSWYRNSLLISNYVAEQKEISINIFGFAERDNTYQINFIEVKTFKNDLHGFFLEENLSACKFLI